MADAPAPSGGGWGAVEVIFGIVLIIGTLSTLSGVSLNSSSKTPATTKKSALASNQYSFNGCTVTLTAPKSKQSIDTSVTVSGSIAGPLDNCASTPTGTNALYAQVVDSKGSTLSALAPIAVTKSIFGEASFSATVPLSGVARSTSAQVIITGPITAAGNGVVIRVPVTLRSAPVGTVYTTNGNPSYTAPAANANTATYTGTNTSTPFNSQNGGLFFNNYSNNNNAPANSNAYYAAPTQQYNPPAQNQNSGSGSNTF